MAIELVVTMIDNARRKEISLFDYQPIPANYWTRINAHYERALAPMIEDGIIEDTVYSIVEGVCKNYRIQPDLISGKFKSITYKKHRDTSKDNSPLCKYTRRVLRGMKLDYRAAKSTINEYIKSGAYKRKIEINPTEAPQSIVELENYFKFGLPSRFNTISFYIDFATVKGLALIRDGRKYIIEDPETFYRRKEINIRFYYMHSIDRFHSRDFYAIRNDGNRRLDHNLTSMPSILLKHFRVRNTDEPLVSYDLSNSQFTIHSAFIERGHFGGSVISSNAPHSHSTSELFLPSFPITPYPLTPLFDNSISSYTDTYMSAKKGGKEGLVYCYKSALPKDMEIYIKLAKNGKLYEYIQWKLELKKGQDGRNEAKNMMFRVFFAGRNDRSTAKVNIRELFPTIVRGIDEYKQINGNASFARVLQLLESKIFIDLILKKLSEMGCHVITKHDSVIFPVSEREIVKAVMDEVLNKYLGEYDLKYETISDGS